MVGVLRNEPEGVVRKEAVNLLACIYGSHNVLSNHLDEIYSSLVYCAVRDLHWEVKIKSLEFWQIIIKQQFRAQGVIDGSFPLVTFSKEKKKIVNLTPKEIISRLTKILDNLSSYGCLNVLLACIEDDVDLSVVRASITVIKTLIEFLDKHNYWDEIQVQDQTSDTRLLPIIDTNYSELNATRPEPRKDVESKGPEETKQSDEVIQSIVSSQDINLLATTYANQLNVEPDTENEFDAQYYKKYTNVTATIFLQKIKSTILEDLIRVRTDWMEHTESFASLLNDMLYSLKIDDVNDIDCY